MNSKQQHGFALIGALIIVALVTSATVAMALRQSSDIDLTHEIIRADQATLHAQAIELWASGLLKQDLLLDKTDSEQDSWNQKLTEVQMEQGTISASIEDLQGRFNINNLLLSNEKTDIDIKRFRRLLDHLGLDVAIAETISDWIDHDTQARFPGGAEDEYYLTQKPAYRAANQVIQDISELRMIRGIDKASYERLLPFVVALPVGVGININMASPEVIMSLADGIDFGQAASVSEIVKTEPVTNIASVSNGSGGQTNVSSGNGSGGGTGGDGFDISSTSYSKNFNDWVTQDNQSSNSTNNQGNGNSDGAGGNSLAGLLTGTNINSHGISVSTDYFVSKGLVEYDNQVFIIGAILYRDSNNGDVYTWSRRYGEYFYE